MTDPSTDSAYRRQETFAQLPAVPWGESPNTIQPPRPARGRNLRCFHLATFCGNRALGESTLEDYNFKESFHRREGRGYITNKPEAERDTVEKLFTLVARKFGTGSSKVHEQHKFRTRNQTEHKTYMQSSLGCLEGFRSQVFLIKKVTVRQYEIMQRVIYEVRNYVLREPLGSKISTSLNRRVLLREGRILTGVASGSNSPDSVSLLLTGLTGCIIAF